MPTAHLLRVIISSALYKLLPSRHYLNEIPSIRDPYRHRGATSKASIVG